jgi:uncharacterized coiled-coil protein SlyX
MPENFTNEMIDGIRLTLAERNKKVCDEKGASLETLIERLNKLSTLELEHAHYDSDPGCFAYSKPLAVPTTQLEATKTLLELRGDVPAKKSEHSFTGSVPIQFADVSEAQKKAVKAFQDTLIKETFGGPDPDDAARS